MQEFSSISVSSYEAGSLADRLTEQARHGWDVVAIVPTGSTVTAYLSRAASADAADDAPASEHTPAEAPAAAPVAETSSAAASWSVLAEEAAAEPEPAPTPEPITVPEIVVPQVTLPEVSQPEPVQPEPVQPVVEPVNEPAGWAVAPESASTSDTIAVSTDPAAGLGSYGSTSSYDSGASIAAAASEVAAEPQQAVVETQQATAAAASAAPAGWYADPSSRYELRYWDGSQWTEHVSRSGQQFTDPPVA